MRNRGGDIGLFLGRKAPGGHSEAQGQDQRCRKQKHRDEMTHARHQWFEATTERTRLADSENTDALT
jgi:hypothetical protein